MIIFCGIIFIYLKKGTTIIGYKIEHFPATLRYTDKIRQTPKRILSKLTSEMKENTKHYEALPDDYDYLYDYEKNFDNTVYGDFRSRLDAYRGFLYKNKNNFHELSDKDVDNLSKLLNSIPIKNSDIPETFSYRNDFTAVNSN